MPTNKPPQTEAQNPRTRRLSALSAARMVSLINKEDLQTVAAVKKAAPAIARAATAAAKAYAVGGKIIFAGAGTSGRLGVLEAAECPPTFGVEPGRVVALIAGGKGSVFKAKEGAEDDYRAGYTEMAKTAKKGDAVITIAASGRTPYALGALAAAKAAGAFTSFITSAPAPAKAADNIIYLPTGPEVLQGSTRMKAATAAKMALNIITTAAMALNGKVYGNLMVDVRATNAKLKARATRLVCTLTGAKEGAAAAALRQTKWQVKPAAVMLKKGLSAAQAANLLKKNKDCLEGIV